MILKIESLVQFKALAAALSQYVSNEEDGIYAGELEHTPELAAAQEYLDQLNGALANLASDTSINTR